MNERIGYTYQDIITGLTGVCIGHVEYITGCHQSLIQPKGEGSDIPESRWIDDQRLKKVECVTKVYLDNGPTPGFGKLAPKI